MTNHKPLGELSDSEIAALVRAQVAGKRIQYADPRSLVFVDIGSRPAWSPKLVYRIAPEPLIPDSINWEHVAPEFKWMARDEDGRAYMFREEPRLERNEWVSSPAGSLAVSFASYRRGTVDWRDSLVRRQS